jgi:D-serine deaminase-like pyridoxal phosphate-dependent protein
VAVRCGPGLGRSGGWGAGVGLVAVQVLGDQVGPDGVAEEIEELSVGADAAGALEVAVVVDGPVDRLGVLTPSVYRLVAGVARRDLAYVLGSVEASGAVLVGRAGG